MRRSIKIGQANIAFLTNLLEDDEDRICKMYDLLGNIHADKFEVDEICPLRYLKSRGFNELVESIEKKHPGINPETCVAIGSFELVVESEFQKGSYYEPDEDTFDDVFEDRYCKACDRITTDLDGIVKELDSDLEVFEMAYSGDFKEHSETIDPREYYECY